jgi:hypothetical protein
MCCEINQLLFTAIKTSQKTKSKLSQENDFLHKPYQNIILFLLLAAKFGGIKVTGGSRSFFPHPYSLKT